MKKEKTDRFYLPIWVLILPDIFEGKSMSQIGREKGICYSSIYDVFSSFERKGVIVRKGLKGRIVDYELNQKYAGLADSCLKMRGFVNESRSNPWH